MKNAKMLNGKEIEKLKSLLILALILNSDFEFSYTGTDNADISAMMQGVAKIVDNIKNRPYLVDCVIISALHILGISNQEALKFILSDNRKDRNLAEIANNKDTDIDLVTDLLNDVIVPKNSIKSK